MGCRGYNGSSQYHSVSNPNTVVSLPVTISAWFRPDQQGTGVTIFGQDNSFDHMWQVNWNAAGTVGDFFKWGSGTGNAVTSVNTGTVDAWNHMVLVRTSTSARVVLNGDQVNAGSNTTSTSDPDFSSSDMSIGCLVYVGSPTQYFSGDIGNVTIWGAALNQSEQSALARGVHPRHIRPQNIDHEWRLQEKGATDSAIDLGSGFDTLAHSASPAVVASAAPLTPWLREYTTHIPDAVVGQTLVSPVRPFRHMLGR